MEKTTEANKEESTEPKNKKACLPSVAVDKPALPVLEKVRLRRQGASKRLDTSSSDANTS